MSYETDSSSVGYAEYITSVKPSRKTNVIRALILLVDAVLVAVMLALTLKTMPMVVVMFSLILVFLGWFAWQYTKVEYEYTIATGELELSRILAAKKRKKIMTVALSDIEKIAPLSECRTDAEALGKANVFYACNQDDAMAYVLFYTEKETAQKKALVISAPEKTIKTLRYFRASAFTVR